VDVLQCPIQRYPWGSTTALPLLLGVAPDGGPQAELWAGAHPAAPATVGGRSLADVINDDPSAALGPDVLRRFGPRLPFLAKILAAAEPLSIQAHPDSRRAREGFAEDEAAGIPIDAPNRRYRDRSHKPELLVALTPFHALAGLRPLQETSALLEALDLAQTHPFDRLESDGPAAVIRMLLGSGSENGREVAARVGEAAAALDMTVDPPSAAADPVEAVAWWASRIAALNPGDPGVGVALLLNLVDLAPGEAVNLRAGNLHAYLRGTGVEVMASSDNVLRGGLTSKHVDVQELLVVADVTPDAPPVVSPVASASGRIVSWPTPDPDFAVSMVRPGAERVSVAREGPRVAMVVDGHVRAAAGSRALELDRGAVIWVPASDGPLALEGEGTTFVAAVGG